MDKIKPPDGNLHHEAGPAIIQGQHIEAFLAFKGWKQSTLADTIGTSQSTVSKWMRGIAVPDATAKQRLFKVFAAEGFFSQPENFLAIDGSQPNTVSEAETPEERLVEARVKAGFRSAQAAARRHDWTESTYRSHENGTRAITRGSAIEYGEAFNVSADWIVYGAKGLSSSTGTPAPWFQSEIMSMTNEGEGRARIRIEKVNKVVSWSVAIQIMKLLNE